MATRRLAHISDLHFGRDAATDAASLRLARTLLAADVDEVLLTGDVTHRAGGRSWPPSGAPSGRWRTGW